MHLINKTGRSNFCHKYLVKYNDFKMGVEFFLEECGS